MEQTKPLNSVSFNEEEWIRLIFQLRDTQNWLNTLVNRAVYQTPVKEMKLMLRSTYLLSVTALAHIIERHYHKIERYSNKGKFTIPISEVLLYLRDASEADAKYLEKSRNYVRCINTGKIIGFDKMQTPTTFITVLTDKGGKIITAFPGNHLDQADAPGTDSG